ncbi:glycosyltransferase [uncultured Veillonella sp.]|uniref:glycosyltransferase n=1 Tax=uncultured Veillonella sp. TaxID=159268 RepID=UPI0025916BEB|nr:glycosyltransferase [uncultured Veillonella sp.]
MIKYSVLMSVYKNDKGQYLEEAINSMVQQTVKPAEIILVEDGPLTTELYEVIDKFKNNYPEIFRAIPLEKNVGLGKALNIGLEHCRYDLVARMDSDDISVENRIETQLAYFEKNQSLDIVGGDIEEFITSPNYTVSQRRVPCSDKEIKEYMRIRCPFNHMSVMFKKRAVINSGNYQHWHYNEDYYLWIRMMEHGCVMANTGTVLVKVRVGKEMYSRRGGDQYFQSEKGLQDYMLRRNIISIPIYLKNVALRFVVQKLLTPSIRGYIFKKFARS